MQRPRTPSKLSDSLHHRLNSYALAASAAGVSVRALSPPTGYLLAAGTALVGVFAFTEPAEARIVYTPVHKNLVCHRTDGGCYGTLKLNLNHGKSADFQLQCTSAAVFLHEVSIFQVNSKNRIWSSSRYSDAAAALYKGAVIQSGSHFLNDQASRMVWSSEGNSGPHGPWVYVQNRYLGLKFLIKGEVHYGWARLSTPKQSFHGQVWATLTGYAYETIPNKPIIAGKTHGKDVVTLEPGSLGHLARGASAVPAWRGANLAK